MERKATYDDVTLILRLYELRREEKIRRAREWFGKFKASTTEEFDALCPPGSEQNAYFRMVISYWDMVASFITSGVLHQELFFESGNELLFVWEKIRDLAPLWRERMKNPRIAENLEKVAEAMVQFHAVRAPEFHSAFRQMVRGAGG